MLKNKSGRRVLKITIITLSILVLIAFVFLTPIDYTPYKEMQYYKETLARIDTLSLDTSTVRSFKAGWAKESIMPVERIPIASYGVRKNFQGIHDSLWVRSFVFEDGQRRFGIVTLDLLIFPPAITEILKDKLPKGFTLENTYLSATHTHNGTGGWAAGAAGTFLAGSYNEDYVTTIVKAIARSIEKATEDLEEAEIGFGKLNAFHLVRNRLVNKGEVDSWLRLIKIKKKSGQLAVLNTFSAHPTCLSSKLDSVSRDYPGALVDSLEKSGKVHFAAFMAGCVGSLGPRNYRLTGFNLVSFIGNQLSYKVLSSIDTIPTTMPKVVNFSSLPLSLREPHFKLSNSLRLRPWVFKWLFGDYSFSITLFRLGDIILVGTPGDFGGPLIEEIEAVAANNGYKLLITSFNGSYLGYITEDKYYHLAKSETREMNWFGPYNSSYFTEVIKRLINKI